jgi:hypothetical protein
MSEESTRAINSEMLDLADRLRVHIRALSDTATACGYVLDHIQLSRPRQVSPAASPDSVSAPRLREIICTREADTVRCAWRFATVRATGPSGAPPIT